MYVNNDDNDNDNDDDIDNHDDIYNDDDNNDDDNDNDDNIDIDNDAENVDNNNNNNHNNFTFILRSAPALMRSRRIDAESTFTRMDSESTLDLSSFNVPCFMAALCIAVKPKIY